MTKELLLPLFQSAMKKYYFLIAVIFTLINAAAQDKQTNLLIGTYTNSCESNGIYSYDFNVETGVFKLKSATEKVINPSYLTLSADKKFVYSVNENGKESTISAFSFHAKNGKFKFLNKQSSAGADPCYLINDEKHVIAANYSGGNIVVFGKNSDGSLTKSKQIVTHSGKSSDEKRQESPHVHMVHFSPDKKFVLANDLGTDRIYLYQYHADSEKEILQFKDTIAIKTGSGPRHLTFSPNGKYIYLLQELDGTLTVFNYGNGKFRRIQETSVVKNDFKGGISAADIHISEDGKFLYATNRGDANSISIFSIDDKGKLALVETIPSGGKGPRNFAIAPGGKFVLVAHQYSNDVIIFKRNETSGLLEITNQKIELCAPVCLVFSPNND